MSRANPRLRDRTVYTGKPGPSFTSKDKTIHVDELRVDGNECLSVNAYDDGCLSREDTRKLVSYLSRWLHGSIEHAVAKSVKALNDAALRRLLNDLLDDDNDSRFFQDTRTIVSRINRRERLHRSQT